MGFFRSDFFFGQHELEFLFFLSRKAQNIFPESNFKSYDKNSESGYFFSSTKIRIFFQQHWESEYFFRKKNHAPPPSLEVKWSSHINFWIWLKIIRITHKIIFWCQIYLKKNNFPFQFDCCNIFCFRFMATRARGRSQKKLFKRKCNRDKVDCCSWIL